MGDTNVQSITDLPRTTGPHVTRTSRGEEWLLITKSLQNQHVIWQHGEQTDNDNFSQFSCQDL